MYWHAELYLFFSFNRFTVWLEREINQKTMKNMHKMKMGMVNWDGLHTKELERVIVLRAANK